MSTPDLNLEETKELFQFVAGRMIGYQDVLTQADKAIGDGDHGVGMSRGFEAVARKLEEESFSTLGDLLQAIGMTLLTAVGGAAGAIFGSFFIGGSASLKEKALFDAEAFHVMLEDGLGAVQKRGGAESGDKTVVDAIEPALHALQNFRPRNLAGALRSAARGAEGGVERTKEMVAQIGKAKTLGERSLGHPDPGALSFSLLLRSMLDYLEGVHQV
jgi:dihydroxyacetone kinase-like protein